MKHIVADKRIGEYVEIHVEGEEDNAHNRQYRTSAGVIQQFSCHFRE